LEKIVL